MADPTGFLKFDRELPPRRPVDIRLLDWKDVYLSRENGEDESSRSRPCAQQAARCMDCGIPFCHHGCPLGNLIPEWNDLVRRDDWARRDRAAARDQQLPGVHREAVPGAVRGLLRAQPAGRPGDDQADRVGDHRPGVRATAASSRDAGAGAHRQEGRRRRLRPGRPGRRAAADPRRARGHRLRAGRPDRRPAALRHPRVQDGEGRARPAAGPDARRGHPVRHRRRGRRQRRGRPVGRAAARPSSTPSSSPGRDGRPRPARARAASWPASTWRWSTCPRQPAGARRARRPADQRRRQARGDHRRRRHRRRLPRHRAPAGRRVGDPAGDHADAAGQPRPRTTRGRPTR